MATLLIDPDTFSPGDLAPVTEWIAAGGIVAFPTDTLYGLAVDPRQDTAVESLFDLKGRDVRMAMPLVGASLAQVEELCGALAGDSARLAARFWPGPLSLILDAPSWISVRVHGGARTIAVRVPAHPLARSLAAAARCLLTATSANVSGQPAAVTVADLGRMREDPRVLVVDGGPAHGGAPSTIVDARRSPPTLIRAGAVPWNRVLESAQE